MTTKDPQSGCNQRLLRGYLEELLSAQQQVQVEQHLCRCQACRTAISDSAADRQWWGNARDYLRGDDWDDDNRTGFSNPDVNRAPFDAIDQHDGSEEDNGAGWPSAVAPSQLVDWLDPTDDPRMLGRFGGYEIVGLIGQGGMGIVLKGFEPALNRYVAIKVLSPLLASSGAARKRFAREAKATAAVLHDNVIPIHRVDESNDLPFLVMPYVPGDSLQKRLDAEGSLDLVAILRIGEQVAAGLAAAHSHGLVHRDIKPANILMERGVERVRLTDFGLARAADDGSLTRTGVIAGTPQYMSPEQARGEAIDARSDLFSLGSVLYTMSTGRLPFRAETPYGILLRIIESRPRPMRELAPALPAWWETLVARLHEKRPEDRLASAAEVAEVLRGCLAHVEQPTAAPLPDVCRVDPRSGSAPRFPAWTRPARYQRAFLALGLLLALAVPAAWIIRWATGQPPTEAVELPPVNSPPALAKKGAKETAGEPKPEASPWDGPATELTRLLEDGSEFESRAHLLWDPPSLTDTTPAISPPPVTPEKEPAR